MRWNKQQKILVSICLACGLSSAQAAINTGTLATATTGEMFLNVFDSSVGVNGSGTTFAIDLGTTVADFLTNIAPVDHTWDLTSSFTSFAGLSNNALLFNVAGNSLYSPVTQFNPNSGVLLSQLTGVNDVRTGLNGVTMSGFYGGLRPIGDRALNINVGISQQDPTISQTDYAANLSITTNDINNAAYWDVSWGPTMNLNQWQGTATVRAGSALDQTLNLIWWHSPAAGAGIGPTTKAIWDQQSGYLTLDVLASTLTWHAAPVPLPGAAWLFLTGLLSFLGIQKRHHIPTAV